MKKVLFDTNIILDIALKRFPHFNYASRLFDLIDQKQIIGHVTASTITDIYYISKKENGHNETIKFIQNLVEIVEVIGVDKNVIITALKSKSKDFEDAVQATAATFNSVDCLITRNENDFSAFNLTILTPQDFLEQDL